MKTEAIPRGSGEAAKSSITLRNEGGTKSQKVQNGSMQGVNFANRNQKVESSNGSDIEMSAAISESMGVNEDNAYGAMR